ncbi:Mannose-1-phosphate [Campylobacter concisus UNSWCD]|nr:Mannose-1-phosphate [Campylobacter concisus UNSWCD]
MGSSILHSASYCGYRLCGMKFLFEAIGRNTASAIALACLSLEYDEIVFVTPSDHLIMDEIAYKNSVMHAQEYAECGF